MCSTSFLSSLMLHLRQNDKMVNKNKGYWVITMPLPVDCVVGFSFSINDCKRSTCTRDLLVNNRPCQTASLVNTRA